MDTYVDVQSLSTRRGQYAIFKLRAFEQSQVTRIVSEFPCIKHIVARPVQPIRQLFASTLINKEFHDSAILTADRLSLAITA